MRQLLINIDHCFDASGNVRFLCSEFSRDDPPMLNP